MMNMESTLQEMRELAAPKHNGVSYHAFTETQRQILLMAVKTSSFSGDAAEDVVCIKNALENPMQGVRKEAIDEDDHRTDGSAESTA